MLHELVLGTADELKKHAELMKKFPGMEHDEPHMTHVKPGRTGEIVWQFTQAGRVPVRLPDPGPLRSRHGRQGESQMRRRNEAHSFDGSPLGVRRRGRQPRMAWHRPPQAGPRRSRRLDKAQGKVTLRHGPLPNLEMPAMTMVFKVADSKMLDGLKEGDKVRFAADRVDGTITVTAIEVVR